MLEREVEVRTQRGHGRAAAYEPFLTPWPPTSTCTARPARAWSDEQKRLETRVDFSALIACCYEEARSISKAAIELWTSRCPQTAPRGGRTKIEIESLNIVIPADPRSVSIARTAVTEMARRLGMANASIDDLRTIVTEACTNAAVHAYPDGGGTIAIQASADDRDITIEVRDQGLGMRPDRKEPEGSTLRLGLALIAALSSRYSISGGGAGGTTVSMTMPIHGSAEALQSASLPPSTAPRVQLMTSNPAILGATVARAVDGFRAKVSRDPGSVAVATSLIGSLLSALPRDKGSGQVGLTIEPVKDEIQVSVGPLSTEDEERLKGLLTDTAERLTPSFDLEILRPPDRPAGGISFTLPN